MKTCVFIAVVVVVGLSEGRFPDEKACCLSSKTREKNFCRGRMIGLSTERLEWRRLTVEICVMKVTGSHRKCVNRAPAQSFHLIIPSFPARISDMRNSFSALSCVGKVDYQPLFGKGARAPPQLTNSLLDSWT